jgi:S-(hydroxymethyl)glutathione dehydrogenase/alcohol dehydrogenase
VSGATFVLAVDPSAFKREQALKTGATHAFATVDEALPVVADLTRGRMADVSVLTPGILRGEHIQQGLSTGRRVEEDHLVHAKRPVAGHR